MDDLYFPTRVAPNVHREWFNGVELDVHKIVVRGSNYEACETASSAWWTKNKVGGGWNPGMLNSSSDPRKTERVGILGEMAFGMMTGMPVNLGYKEFGNVTDFDVFSYGLDVKTAARNYGLALIRCIDEYGKRQELGSDIYAFAYVESEDKAAGEAVISYIGYQTREKIVSRPIVCARRGNHRNYEIPYPELKPMSKFLSLFDKAVERSVAR